MNEHESFSNRVYEEQTHMAERDLSSVILAVTELYGSEQARLSAQDKELVFQGHTMNILRSAR